jgi:RNA polymerase sigma factor (sigma-70 family)
VIDPREKLKLFEETLAENSQWLNVIARNNAPVNGRRDLEQEIRIAFWQSLDRYDGKSSSLRTWFFAVAQRKAKKFRNKNHKMKKSDEAVYPNPVFVEQGRDQLEIIEEFTERLGDLDRQVFTMHLENFSYAEMSAALGVEEVNLRKRMSRIKEHFKANYRDY